MIDFNASLRASNMSLYEVHTLSNVSSCIYKRLKKVYAMDTRLKQCFLLITTTIIIMISATAITVLLQQYNQTAQAFPCVGDDAGKEYCTGYHDGAIEARRDFNIGADLDIEQHRCTHNSSDYCNGYDKGYNDEADFLG
jgi:hypothetical protein